MCGPWRAARRRFDVASGMKRRVRFSRVGVVFACAVWGCATPSALTHVDTTDPAGNVDADGVAMLFPSATGVSFRLGAGNPNALDGLTIEKGTVAASRSDGGVRYWNVASYPLDYSSGGSGWTSRVHLYASGGSQRYTWRTQAGYLSSPSDAKNQEFTAYVRVHGILDAPRAQVTLKIRGGSHSTSNPDLASCVMMTFGAAGDSKNVRFAKELVHPTYDYVTLSPRVAVGLRDSVWVGLKLVSWNDPKDATRVLNRLYVDAAPFTTRGTPANNWQLMAEYVDVAGKSTGTYSTLANWGGWQTTLRTDGFRDIDFALLSVREIVPPTS